MFAGETFEPARDGARLASQLERVKRVMIDGRWRTLAEIAGLAGAPEASISARLRNLREERHGAFVVHREHIGGGLHRYRIEERAQLALGVSAPARVTLREMREGFLQLEQMAKHAKVTGFEFSPELVRFCRELRRKYG